MLPDPRTRFALVVALVLALASFATQAQSIDHLASEIEDTISRLGPVGVPLEAAKTLFWSLAVISLVWTIGMHVLRQDIGEVLMELVRFSVVTGIFYWLLINASEENGGGGFIGDIVGTFFELGDGIGGASYRVHADAFVSQGLHTLFSAIKAAENADMSDQLLTGGIAILILVMLTIVAAQFLMALVMAWLLGYAGIFLLGFGGARWSSPLAISYYKHAVAMGIMLLVLGLVGKGGLDVFDKIGNIGMRRADSQYTLLGVQLAASVLLLVAGVRIPQFFYTMVTGSQLGMFAGAAGMIGSAIATGGGAAIAAATGHIATGGAGGGPGGRSSPGGARAESVMDAVLRSSAGTAGSDAFHVGSGTDPFGVPRSADGYRRGSVFGSVADVPGTATVTASDRATVRDERRDVPKTTRDEVSDAENAPRDAMHPNETGGTDPGSPPDYAAELDAIHRARDKAGNAPIVGDTLSETPPASAHFEHTGSNRLPTSAAAAAVPNMSAREDAPGMITGHDPSADTHRVDVRGAGFERVTDDTGTVGISEDRRQDMHAGDENPLASMPHVIRNGLAGDHAEPLEGQIDAASYGRPPVVNDAGPTDMLHADPARHETLASVTPMVAEGFAEPMLSSPTARSTEPQPHDIVQGSRVANDRTSGYPDVQGAARVAVAPADLAAPDVATLGAVADTVPVHASMSKDGLAPVVHRDAASSESVRLDPMPQAGARAADAVHTASTRISSTPGHEDVVQGSRMSSDRTPGHPDVQSAAQSSAKPTPPIAHGDAAAEESVRVAPAHHGGVPSAAVTDTASPSEAGLRKSDMQATGSVGGTTPPHGGTGAVNAVDMASPPAPAERPPESPSVATPPPTTPGDTASHESSRPTAAPDGTARPPSDAPRTSDMPAAGIVRDPSPRQGDVVAAPADLVAADATPGETLTPGSKDLARKTRRLKPDRSAAAPPDVASPTPETPGPATDDTDDTDSA